MCLVAVATVTCLTAAFAQAGKVEEEEIAVHSKIFNDYTRTPSVLGGYQAETFAFANGGALLGRMRDRSVDDATFDQVVRLISPALTRQNYIAASDPEDTDLLIYVTWGVTDGLTMLRSATYGGLRDFLINSPNGNWYGDTSAVEHANRQRDGTNLGNAALLGYREAMLTHKRLRALDVNRTVYDDLAADVEEPRYFVILTAFDFRMAWKEKKLVPLWSTRYNIASLGNHFTAALPDMSMFASRFFGRDSGGLVRRLNPIGKVEMDDIQILGAVEEPAK
jgi:hypothetical protein